MWPAQRISIFSIASERAIDSRGRYWRTHRMSDVVDLVRRLSRRRSFRAAEDFIFIFFSNVNCFKFANDGREIFSHMLVYIVQGITICVAYQLDRTGHFIEMVVVFFLILSFIILRLHFEAVVVVVVVVTFRHLAGNTLYANLLSIMYHVISFLYYSLTIIEFVRYLRSKCIRMSIHYMSLVAVKHREWEM